MITAKSSFSFARFLSTYKNVIHRKRGSLVFLSCLSFVFLGLQYILAIVEYNRSIVEGWGSHNFELYGPSGVYTGFAMFGFFLLQFVAILSVATDLFGYMHNKRSTDVYHSLPLTRDELYLANGAAGMTLISVPIIINFLIVAACSFLVPGQNAGMILLEMLCWLAIAFATFSIAAFCAVNAGTVFDSTIFSIGTVGSIAWIYLSVIGLFGAFVYGVSLDAQVVKAYKLSPVSVIVARQMMDPFDNMSFSSEIMKFYEENNLAVLLWLAVGAAIFILGMYCYRRRKSEIAEMVGTMGPLQIFLRSAGTFVGGVVMAAIFCSMWEIGDSKVYFLAATVVSSLVVYFIGDVLLSRTVKSIPKSIKPALATVAAVTMVSAAIINGGLGVENYVPKRGEVSSVSFDHMNSYLGYNNIGMVLESDEAVNLILEAHKAQLEAHKNGEDNHNGGSIRYDNFSFRPKYALENGKMVTRHYYEVSPDTAALMAQLEATKEFTEQMANVYAATPDMIDVVSVQNILCTDRQENDRLTPAQKEELLSALRADLIARDKNELLQGETGIAYLTLEYRYKLINGRDPFQRETVYVENSMMGVTISTEEAAFVSGEASVNAAQEERYYYNSFDVIITDSFTNTLKVLRDIGFDKALENDFSNSSKIMATVLDYSYPMDGGVIVQTTREDMKVFYENRYEYAEENEEYSFMTELSRADFDAVKGSLTNFMVNDGKTVYVGIRVFNENNVLATFFAPLEALPEAAKHAVCTNALVQYNADTLINSGYVYLDN